MLDCPIQSIRLLIIWSAFVKLIQTSSELQQAYHDLENFPLNFRDQERERALLIEEYICGEEISVETVSNNGEITVVGITDKSVTGSPYFIENGHMFPAKLEEDAKETHVQLETISWNSLNM